MCTGFVLFIFLSFWLYIKLAFGSFFFCFKSVSFVFLYLPSFQFPSQYQLSKANLRSQLRHNPHLFQSTPVLLSSLRDSHSLLPYSLSTLSLRFPYRLLMYLQLKQVSPPSPSQWQLALVSLCPPWPHLLQQLPSQGHPLWFLVSFQPFCSLALSCQVRSIHSFCQQQFSPWEYQLTLDKLLRFLFFPLEMFCTRYCAS